MNIFFAHTAKTLADTCDNSSVDIFSPFVFFRRIHGLGCSHVLAWSTSRWRWKSRTSTIHYKKIWNQRTKNQIGHWYVVFFFNKTDFFFFTQKPIFKNHYYYIYVILQVPTRGYPSLSNSKETLVILCFKHIFHQF